MTDLKVRFDDMEDAFEAKFAESDAKRFVAGMGEIQFVTPKSDLYKGEYVVTPKTETQTMPTKGKVMDDNVTIKPIPYVESDNAAGGKTVIIG